MLILGRVIIGKKTLHIADNGGNGSWYTSLNEKEYTTSKDGHQK
jgi:hypothetical protein